jgi:hypothetical protein
VSDEDKKQKLTDIPPLAAICIIATTFALFGALLLSAPVQVTGPIAGLLAALGLYIKKALS